MPAVAGKGNKNRPYSPPVLSSPQDSGLYLFGPSKPKSISCDGIYFFGEPISYTADQEKIYMKLGEYDGTTIFADKDEVTVQDSKIIINDNDPIVQSFIGKGPFELSLETCPTGLTPAVQYFIP